MDILFYLMYAIPFFAFGLMICFAVPFFRLADRMPWWEQAGRVVVLALLLTAVFSFTFIDLGSHLSEMGEYASYFTFSGLSALGFLRVAQLLRRFVPRFDVQQLAEFVAILVGSGLGAFVGNVVNHWLLDRELLWRTEGLESLMWIDVYFVVILASIIAFMRLLSNFQELGHQKEETERLREMELLRAAADRSKLQAIQARLNPHFLYNSLNSLASQVHTNPDRAEQMCIDLARMFRDLLERQGEGPVLVMEAVELLRTYLDIEKARFGDGLRYRLNVSPEAALWKLPRFLMQPLVENAVLHAQPSQGEPVLVDVDAKVSHGCLVLTVADNGGPFPDPMPGGFGLQSVSDTLELLYPDRYAMEFRNPPAKAVVLTLKTKEPKS